MKGDRVEIVVDAGDNTMTYDVTATRAGRRVEVVNRRGLIEVSEVTRGGTPVRTARFMASRVLALGPLEDVFTERNLSKCFGVPLALDRRGYRWSARAVL